MRLALILTLLFLTACERDRRADILEADYTEAVTTGDQCRIATEIAAIYLEKSDEKNYRHWKSLRDVSCLSVSIVGNQVVQ